ncbi:MAG: response regulator transcription factor [Oscillospiraceae bacterium]|nr:response regulator transcription factor [Oscillospiraceae bacterium]
MAKILIAEDNPDYQELLINFLENAGHEITAAFDGKAAVDIALGTGFDLILLDLMLPKLDGYEVCRRIRASQDIPVIMLTALESEEHQIRGYDMNIDDYITKPVSMTLLIQKVNAVLRRTVQSQPQTIIFRDIQLDTKAHTVCVSGNPVELTLREYQILLELMKCPGEVVTRKRLIDTIWGYEYYDDTRIVDTHIKNIRKKLSDSVQVDTVRGVGYKLRNENI